MNPPYHRYLRCLLPGLLLAAACVPPVRADDLVRSVQEELRRRNLYFGDVDGVRSQQVAAALRRYQQRKGFQPTGEIDDTTLRSLSLAPAETASADTPAPPSSVEPAGPGAASPSPSMVAATVPSWPELPVLRSDRGREPPPPPGAEPADANLDPPTPPAPKPPPAATFQRRPALDARVRGFVESYLHTGESNEPGVQEDFYSEHVNYFNEGTVDRRFIARDTERYNERWPERRFTLLDPVEVEEAPNHGNIVVNFHLRFAVRRPGHDVQGETANTYVLERTGPASMRLVAIKETRVRGK